MFPEWYFVTMVTILSGYDDQVRFDVDIFGTFRQTVVFDPGSEPVIVREVCADTAPVLDKDQLEQDLKAAQTGRWDIARTHIIEFQPK